MRRGEEVRGGMGVGCRGEAGRVGGRGVERVQVGMEIGCHVVRGDCGRHGVLGVRPDQSWVPVNGEGLILINDQRALGAAACAASS